MAKKKQIKKKMKVVLAYSGGLDTSVIIQWLRDEYDCEVIAFAADLGQGEELSPLKQKAIASGASKIYIEDLREEFVRDYVFTILKANALYEGVYYLGTSVARPLIAKKQMEIAARENAEAVSHGATGKGNDQVRFELSYLAINPKIKIIAPWREWSFKSRTDLIAYAKKHKIPVTVSKSKPYSTDRNLLHISFEGGILEDPAKAAPDNIFVLTVSPKNAPDKATAVTIDFEQGVPVAVNSKKLSPANLLAQLNAVGGANGIGRADIVENRFVGMKSRGVYETPGGTILYAAHRALEGITMDREVMYLRDSLMPRFAQMVYNGFWFSPEFDVMKQMIDATQVNVTGRVKLELYKGNCSVLGRSSKNSLYNSELATFEKDSLYDQKHAEGFIKLNALRLTALKGTEKKHTEGR